MNILDELDEQQQTEKILKDFLLLVSEKSDNKDDVVGCQAFIYSTKDGTPFYMGADSQGFIKDKETGKSKLFKLREIAGLLLSVIPGVLESINERITDFLKRISVDYKIEQGNVCVSITTEFTTLQDIRLMIYDKDIPKISKGEINMKYVFPEETEEKTEIEKTENEETTT